MADEVQGVREIPDFGRATLKGRSSKCQEITAGGEIPDFGRATLKVLEVAMALAAVW